MFAGRPGNFFDPHSAGLTIDPPHAINKVHEKPPKRHELEVPHTEVIVASAGPMTARADGFGAAARTNVDLDGLAVRADASVLVNEARKVVTLVEEGDDAHACGIPRPCCQGGCTEG